ncbi:MAG: ABC transporter ATP-binding protein [Acidobacteriaceae bacterium]
MQSTLEFRDVHKSFGRKEVLRNIRFSVFPGEIVGFLGANGAGKTTAISIALGLLRPSKGAGDLLGHPFGDHRGRARVGYLPDAPVFFAHSTNDAVRFAAKLQGVPDREVRGRVEHVLEMLPIAGVKEQARRLSRGQQQYLALAQALVNDPELLVLDEPTSALDPNAVVRVRELLRAARNAGKSVFLSSHQLTEVERTCDRVLFLHEGRIVREGTLHELAAPTGHFTLTVRGLPVSAEIWKRTQLTPLPNAENVTVNVANSDVRPVMEAVWAAGGEVLGLTQQRQGLEELFRQLATVPHPEDRPYE